MRKPRTREATEREIVQSIHALKESLDERNSYERFWISSAHSFTRGVFYGLGALAAVAIVMPFVVWFLTSIAWPPIVAGFVTRVIDQIDRVERR